MRTNWEPIIQVVFCSVRIQSLCWLAVVCLLNVPVARPAALGAEAQSGHRPTKKKPAPPPKPPAPKAVGAAGLISVAQHELNLGNYAAAAEYANAAASKAPILNDYAQYVRAQAEYKLKKLQGS